MRYESVEPVSRARAHEVLAGDDDLAICRVLVSLAFHDPDCRWVQQLCLDYLQSSKWELRSISATCLGHLARIHRTLDMDLVLPALSEAASDPRVRPYVDDAIDDIRQFVRHE